MPEWKGKFDAGQGGLGSSLFIDLIRHFSFISTQVDTLIFFCTCPPAPSFPSLSAHWFSVLERVIFKQSPEREGEMEFPRILAWAAEWCYVPSLSLRSRGRWGHRWEMITCSICLLSWPWSNFLMLRVSKPSPKGPQSLDHSPTKQMWIWKLPFLWTPSDFSVSSTLPLLKMTYPCLKIFTHPL